MRRQAIRASEASGLQAFPKGHTSTLSQTTSLVNSYFLKIYD
jgi:hypothetical protein